MSTCTKNLCAKAQSRSSTTLSSCPECQLKISTQHGRRQWATSWRLVSRTPPSGTCSIKRVRWRLKVTRPATKCWTQTWPWQIVCSTKRSKTTLKAEVASQETWTSMPQQVSQAKCLQTCQLWTALEAASTIRNLIRRLQEEALAIRSSSLRRSRLVTRSERRRIQLEQDGWNLIRYWTKMARCRTIRRSRTCCTAIKSVLRRT